MNCREFREIADTYLSDELLVETNHEVFRHLENCPDCRAELSTRRDIRTRLRSAVKNDDKSIINPIFANKLRANLREEATPKSWFDWRIFAPVLASLLIAISLSFVYIYNQKNDDNFAQSYLHKIALLALNRHEDCGLNHLKEWQANADKISSEKTTFVKSLIDNKTKILEAHDCEFEGKIYTHYILQNGEKIISVVKTETENEFDTNKDGIDAIMSETQHGFQVASFQDNSSRIFVVSDLSEAENLSLARKLSDSI
jgi:hypothetical protein